jgi:uncharacterized protein with NRDE domain
MCLIAMAWGVSPEYPLVIASNRDEFYARPTAALAHWHSPAGQTIVSGRDLQSGGTWMGFTPQGRFAMLTNVRNPAASVPAGTPSRGDLVIAWLESALSASAWSAQHNLTQYAGFNLIVGDWQTQQCHYISNQNPPQSIPKGQVIGLSNAALNTPWPKTTQLVNRLSAALQASAPLGPLQAHLQTILKNDQLADDASLPQTGVPWALEKALSSVYVRYPHEAPVYGTRTSLCAVLGRDHHLHLTETTHLGPTHTALQLAWPPAR